MATSDYGKCAKPDKFFFAPIGDLLYFNNIYQPIYEDRQVIRLFDILPTMHYGSINQTIFSRALAIRDRLLARALRYATGRVAKSTA